MRSLEVILKVAERCNLNCTYCYFFNRGDRSFENNPALMRESLGPSIGRFVSDGATALGVRAVQFYIHGGEPLLCPAPRLESIVGAIRREMAPEIVMNVALQTNGVLIDNEWLDVFARQDWAVSVSLDGPAYIHDRQRLGHKEEPSYDAAARGYLALKRAFEDGRLRHDPGVLAVIDPAASGAEVYRHFRIKLGAKLMDFLLPDFSHDDCPTEMPDAVGRYLEEVFDEWITEDNPDVDVRLLSTALRLKMGRSGGLMGFGSGPPQSLAVTISSAGVVQVDDTLRPLRRHLSVPELTVESITLADFLHDRGVAEIMAAQERVPPACSQCRHRDACGGGPLQNRFSQADMFERPSSMCSANMRLFDAAARVVAHIAA